MTRRHYRVGPAIWDEPWDDDTRLVAFYILTSPHRTTEGLFRIPLTYAQADMGWPAKRFQKAWASLVAAGFVAYDADAQVCWITKALRWQKPQNPNQVTGAVRALRELPPTVLFGRFVAVAEVEAPALAAAIREDMPKRFTNGSPTVAVTVPEALPEPVANTPSPTPSINPPDPPKGGSRQRDRDEYDNQLRTWALETIPGADPFSVVAATKHALSRLNGAQRSAKGVRWIAATDPADPFHLGDDGQAALRQTFSPANEEKVA